MAACRRAKAAAFPSLVETEPKASTDPPLRSHLVTACSSPRAADEKIAKGREAAGEPQPAGSPASSEIVWRRSLDEAVFTG